MRVNGRFLRAAVGAVLGAMLALGASGCSSGPSEANSFCHGMETASPGSSSAGGVNVKAILQGEQSGDAGLDSAAAALLKAVNEHNSEAVANAILKVGSACNRLGLTSSQ